MKSGTSWSPSASKTTVQHYWRTRGGRNITLHHPQTNPTESRQANLFHDQISCGIDIGANSVRAVRFSSMASASDPILIDDRDVPFLSPSGTAPTLFKKLWSYWRGLPSPDHGVPLFSSFDPIEVSDLLPYLFLTQVLYDPLDFRFRVVGTHVEERMGATYTGTRLSDWVHTSKESGIWRNMSVLVDSRQAILANYSYIGPVPQITMTKNLYIPLQNVEGRITDVLIAVHFENDMTVSHADTRWSA